LINQCQFNSNHATKAGGAVSYKSGTIVDSKGSGNYAAQCMDVYNELTGSCSTLST
jgi:predicted outer membrane repeat protein